MTVFGAIEVLFLCLFLVHPLRHSMHSMWPEAQASLFFFWLLKWARASP